MRLIKKIENKLLLLTPIGEDMKALKNRHLTEDEKQTSYEKMKTKLK
jgi:hypothetical protein